ncbi:putative RNA-binding protein (RRM superfamily) protein [Dioscorea alata]|uniref:RNA-binding protein (RRM superfamily) protein n=1 Tax=Dioscorea alata TaxID=55571 RepID=A0ACB7V3H6_DIOAL|nr:putative RNA-binding protein (RRM superfamily) protein [Dioscorea alata]
MWVPVLGRQIACASLDRAAYLLQRRFTSEIFVSRLSYYITDGEFKKAFSPFGDIKEVRLIRDGTTKRPKGYGFIAYASEAEAMRAVEAMDGRIFGGRLIFVELAKPNQPSSQS